MDERRFVGGMRFPGEKWWLGANATWPLAELVIDDHRGVVRLRKVLRPLVGRELNIRGLHFGLPAIRFDRGSVTVAPYSGRLLSSPGVRIRPDGGRSVIFWTRDRDGVLKALVEWSATASGG